MTRYFEVCPRGFANEVTIYRVRDADTAEVEECFAESTNAAFSNGNTSATYRWLDTPNRSQRAASVAWEDDLHCRTIRAWRAAGAKYRQ